jgi:hypothetical protein
MNQAHSLSRQLLTESEKYHQLYKNYTHQLSNTSLLKPLSNQDSIYPPPHHKPEIPPSKTQAQFQKKDENIKIQDNKYNSIEDAQSVSIAQVGAMPPNQTIDASRNKFESTSQNEITLLHGK